MKIIVLALAIASFANAGVLRTIVNVNVTKAAKTAVYPVRHPLKTLKAVKTALI